VRRALAAACSLSFAALLALGASAQPAQSNRAQSQPEKSEPALGEPAAKAAPEREPTLRDGAVLIATVKGTINPASADYLVSAIEQAEREEAALLIVELDTPGGILSAAQEIVQAILDADVPIAVFVSPRGAWAASAGAFITMAGHIAAMTPDSSIGAAHPVNPFGGNERGPAQDGEEGPPPPADLGLEKAENFTVSFIEAIARERGRNVEWAAKAVRESIAATAHEALELNVIDLVARDRAELLEQVDGRVVEITSGRVRLAVADAEPRELPMGLLARFLHAIWDPTIALMLLTAGGVLLWIEFSTPGVSVPGILGAICILVGAVSLSVVPFSWLGLLLFVGGLVLMGLELVTPAHGALFAAGVLAMLLGGSLVFDRPDASDLNVPFWSVVAPIVGSFAAFAGLVAFSVGRVLRRPSKLGEGELIGMRGVASTALTPSGTVALRGELWSADADGEIAQGESVEVTEIDGMRLRVRRAAKRG
jgi:membrane-bound serine protease (ClpP class)